MQRIRRLTEKIIPIYALLPLLMTFGTNCLVYGGAKLIVRDWPHYSMETVLDQKIPFVPWTLAIYFGCYLFWVANYILIAREEKQEVYRFLSGDTLARIICLAFFLLLPMTNTRPQVPDEGFWNRGMRFLYAVDSPENLFPSIHCMTSWFCYIGVRRRKEIPVWYRGFSAAAAVAVFLSTLTTKQHVLADVAGGVLLAEGCWWLSGHTGMAAVYGRVMDFLTYQICFKEKKRNAAEGESSATVNHRGSNSDSPEAEKNQVRGGQEKTDRRIISHAE